MTSGVATVNVSSAASHDSGRRNHGNGARNTASINATTAKAINVSILQWVARCTARRTHSQPKLWSTLYSGRITTTSRKGLPEKARPTCRRASPPGA
jgi:hypothetical protein